MTAKHGVTTRIVAGVLLAGAMTAAASAQPAAPTPLGARLTEWMVKLSDATVRTGPVTFTVANEGSVPHAFEIEGPGLERETALIQPGENATLTLTLQPGTYRVYCPVGRGSHQKLGMEAQLKVVRAASPTASAPQPIRVTGGGPVVQILPGAFPFPDSAGPILKSFGVEHEALESQSQNGPYSNNVALVSGRFTFSAWDLGAVRDSVDGVAEFSDKDGTRWKVVLDRVQTQDVPHHPKFGGVIRGLYYHGATGVHTPLVPTINSAVALWAFGHLYKNGERVTDNAYVHVMLLSRTRSEKDYTLACWDCSGNRIEELQLQITAAPGEPRFDAPGGFLFVNWERSTSLPAAN